MSETAPMGEAATVSEATETAGKQFTGKAPVEAPKEKSEPDLSKMTGAEAKAYVEAQKAKEAKGDKKSPIKKAAEDAAKKLAPKESKSPAPETAEVAALKEEIRKYKVKVDGEELEVDENELLRGYSHQKAANKILHEGKAARKQAEEFISMMKDPAQFYDTAKKLGHDPRKLAEEYLARQLEDEMMDPRDKELRDAKARLKQIEDMELQQKQALEKQRHEALKMKFAKDYEEQFTTALKESQLPPTKAMVAEMAKYISRSAKIGFQMTAKEAAQLVREDLELSIKRLTGEADADTLIRLLGDGVANKVREHDVAKLKSPEQYLKTPQTQGEIRERKVPHKRMSAKEWREFNRK
jgi:hypothetical protein